jgi:hypothetical protein
MTRTKAHVVVSLVMWTAVATGAVAAERQRPRVLTKAEHARSVAGARPGRSSDLSPLTRTLVQAGLAGLPGRLPTFPQWTGSFTWQGTEYPYVMAGGDPRRGGETEIKTVLIPLRLVFDGFADASGNPVAIETQPDVPAILGSPNFVEAEYSVGEGQYGDAVQRASFYGVAGRGWHTELRKPRVAPQVTIEVPAGQGEVVEVDGQYFGHVNPYFMLGQAQALLPLSARTDELPIAVSRNVDIYFFSGYHAAFEVTSGGRTGVQTWVWAEWTDDFDAAVLSHEVAEWLADPYAANQTVAWASADQGGFCNYLLEVADASEFLPRGSTTVTVRGRTYHVAVPALISWFSGDTSTTYHHAYSYPDTGALTAPLTPCPYPL